MHPNHSPLFSLCQDGGNNPVQFFRILWTQKGQHPDAPMAHYLVHVYAGTKPVVVISELFTNTGASVTNAATEIVTQLYLELATSRLSGASIEDILWVEAYGAFSYQPSSTKEATRYAQIELDHGQPKWRHVEPLQLARWIGAEPEDPFEAIAQLSRCTKGKQFEGFDFSLYEWGTASSRIGR